jgi:hypothetical protein
MKMWSYTERRQQFITLLLLLLLFVFFQSKCDFIILVRITVRVRIANQVGEGSRCRGGIVHIRDVRSCALSKPPVRSKALWRFRVSTSNSPSGRSWQHTNTPIRQIDHTFAQQDIRVCDIRVCEDDPF